MFNIFRKQNTIECEKQNENIDDPDIPTTSNVCTGLINEEDSLEKLEDIDSNLTSTILDLGSIDFDPRRPTLTVSFIFYLFIKKC